MRKSGIESGAQFRLVELLALSGYEVIDVKVAQIHKGWLLSNMPWSEILELKGKTMSTCLPEYPGEKEAADFKGRESIFRIWLESLVSVWRVVWEMNV